MHDSDKLWEYAVFVTNVANPLEFVGQFYSDRADAAGLQLVELVLHGRAPAGAA